VLVRSTESSQWRHDDAILELDGSNLERLEQSGGVGRRHVEVDMVVED
jgi:hypothetical protein